MFTEQDLISLNGDFIECTNLLAKILQRVEGFLNRERDITPGQLMYLTDARAKVEASLNIVGTAAAQHNDLLDSHKFNPDYDPRNKMGV